MRVAFLTHYYPPEAGAPQARISALARGLVRADHDVTVHTCTPHYPDGVVPEPWRNLPCQVEVEDGVRVVRSIVYTAANRGTVKRLADHASFAVGALLSAPLARAQDVVVVETPPLFLAGAGVLYAALKRARLVLHVADLWPDSAIELGALRGGPAIAAARRLERFAYRHSSAIVAPTDGIVDRLDRRPESTGKVHKVPPSVDLRAIAPTDRPRRQGPIHVVYAGTVGMAQGVGTLVEAARIAGPETVRVSIAGGGAEQSELRRRVEQAGIRNVRLLGVLDPEGVVALLGEADAAAVLLRDREVFAGALPTKLLEAMAAGLPVLLSARGEAARFVDEAKAGYVVAPEDPRALAESIRTLAGARAADLQELGMRARRAAESHGREATVARWESLLAELVPTRRSPSR